MRAESKNKKKREDDDRTRTGGPGGKSSLYIFGDQHFTTKLKSEHGKLKILQKFRERSKLLRGLENFRVVILEADPQTFIVPNHWDADSLFFVLKAFFGSVGENPESFYRAFSTEILEAALNTRRDRLEQVFGQQREGIIVKASEEQIRTLSCHEEGGIWPFGHEWKGPFNLLDKRPTKSNQYGRLHEVDVKECRDLQDLNMAVSFANLTQGSMLGPFYNSKATKIAIVLNGEGYF